jgi:hypothetical protein
MDEFQVGYGGREFNRIVDVPREFFVDDAVKHNAGRIVSEVLPKVLSDGGLYAVRLTSKVEYYTHDDRPHAAVNYKLWVSKVQEGKINILAELWRRICRAMSWNK